MAKKVATLTNRSINSLGLFDIDNGIVDVRRLIEAHPHLVYDIQDAFTAEYENPKFLLAPGDNNPVFQQSRRLIRGNYYVLAGKREWRVPPLIMYEFIRRFGRFIRYLSINYNNVYPNGYVEEINRVVATNCADHLTALELWGWRRGLLISSFGNVIFQNVRTLEIVLSEWDDVEFSRLPRYFPNLQHYMQWETNNARPTPRVRFEHLVSMDIQARDDFTLFEPLLRANNQIQKLKIRIERLNGGSVRLLLDSIRSNQNLRTLKVEHTSMFPRITINQLDIYRLMREHPVLNELHLDVKMEVRDAVNLMQNFSLNDLKFILNELDDRHRLRLYMRRIGWEEFEFKEYIHTIHVKRKQN